MAFVHVLAQMGIDQQRQHPGIEAALAHQKVEKTARAPQRHAPRRQRPDDGGRVAQRRQVGQPRRLIALQQRPGEAHFHRVGGDGEGRRPGLARHEQQVDGIAGIGLAQDLEACRFDHAAQRGGREMEKMLVDEPFFHDVAPADQGDVGRIQHQQAARLECAGMVLQRRERFGQMFDGVTGMDDVEAFLRQHGVFDARLDQLGARQVGAGLGEAFVRLDSGDLCVRRRRKESLGEAAAVGTDIQQLQARAHVGAGRDGLQRDVGAKALAVADIAPVGATGHGGGVALRRSRNARITLNKPAMAAEIDAKAARPAVRFMDGGEVFAAAEIAMQRHVLQGHIG